MPKYRRGSGSVYKRGKTFWIAYYRQDGKQVCESAKTTDKIEAREKLKQRLGEIATARYVGPEAERVTVAELLATLVDDYKVNHPKSLHDVDAKTRLHLLPFFGNRTAHSLKTSDLNAYIALRIEEGAARGSISIELTQLRRSYNLALQAERITKKPHFPTIKLNNARKGFFEKADVEHVLAKLPEHARGPISFAYVTGWRLRSEVLPLTWAQVDFDGGRVRLEPGTTKNREGRWFPMTTELRAVLSEAWQEHLKNRPDCPYVFHFQGERILRLDRTWKTASKEAGPSGKLMHDFRRTAVRNLVRAGISERVAMMLTGHKTRVVFDRYNIVSEADLTEAGQRLDEAFSLRTTTVSTTIAPQTTESAEILQ